MSRKEHAPNAASTNSSPIDDHRMVRITDDSIDLLMDHLFRSIPALFIEERDCEIFVHGILRIIQREVAHALRAERKSGPTPR